MRILRKKLGYKLNHFEVVSVYINANIKSFLPHVTPQRESLTSFEIWNNGIIPCKAINGEFSPHVRRDVISFIARGGRLNGGEKIARFP